MLNIYSGFFMEDTYTTISGYELDNKHITWEFNPGECSLPENIKEDDMISVKIIGEFAHEGFHALHVQFNNENNAANGNPMHISLAWPEGHNPGEMGFLMADNSDKIISVPEEIVQMRAGFFKS